MKTRGGRSSPFPVLVASRFVVRVAWSKLPEELRAQVRLHKGPRGTYLAPCGAAGEAWINDAVRRFGVRRWRRNGWEISRGVKKEGGVIQ